MKKSILFVLLIVSFFSVRAQDSISVLFIGNSYTYVNDLPVMLRDLASSLNKEVTIGSKVNGGFTFQNHVNDPATYTAINQNPWDVVVIQGQSQEPSFPTSQVNSSSYPYAMQLSDSVLAHNACSNVMYFMTWGRQNGDPQWDSINTFDKMNGRLYNAYRRFADSADAMVSAVGAVWNYVRDNYPTINLYSGDGSHPSVEGSYVAACTFYTSLFRQSPVGATFLAGLDPTVAANIQTAAATVILDSLDHFFIRPVDSPTQAGFTLIQNGGSIAVESNSIHATNWQWDFGDGSNGVGESTTHTFSQSGTYTIELIATSDCNSDTSSITVLIELLGVSELFQDIIQFKVSETDIRILADADCHIKVYTTDGRGLGDFSMLSGDELTLDRKAELLLFLVEFNNSVKIYKMF
jgi:PKD repeat protein